jgi:hypothetical protein
MKLIFTLILSVFLGSAVHSQTKLDLIKNALDSRIHSFLRKEVPSMSYTRGDFKIEDAVENSNTSEIDGTVHYSSQNCGNVNTEFRATVKLLLGSYTVTQLCIKLPTCTNKIELRKKEYCD